MSCYQEYTKKYFNIVFSINKLLMSHKPFTDSRTMTCPIRCLEGEPEKTSRNEIWHFNVFFICIEGLLQFNWTKWVEHLFEFYFIIEYWYNVSILELYNLFLVLKVLDTQRLLLFRHVSRVSEPIHHSV